MAAREDVGALVARLVADTEGLRADMRKAQAQINSATGKMNRHLATVDKNTARLSKGFNFLKTAITGAATAMAVRFIKSSLDASAQILDTATKVGIGVEALQSLRFAAMQYGIQQNVTDMALQRFSRRIGEAVQGQGELLKTVQQYNIQLTDSAGKTRSVEAILGDYAEVVKNADSDQEALRLAFKAFDSEGAAFVNLMRGGRDALVEFDRQAHNLGIVMDEEMIKKARQASIDLNIMANVLRTQVAVAASEAAPAISQFGGAVTNALSFAVKEATHFGTFLGGIAAGAAAFFRGDFAGAAEIFGTLKNEQQPFMVASQAAKAGGSGAAPSPFALPEGGVAGGIGGGAGGGGTGSPLDRLLITVDAAKMHIIESTREAHATVMEAEASLSASIAAEAQKRVQIEQQAQQQITLYRQAALGHAVAFLSALGSEHRGAAIAALAIQKALAVKEVLIQSQVAAMRALAELGPIAGPPVAAKILASGKLSAAFIAATGLVEASQLSRGTASLGTPANPIHVQPTSSLQGNGAEAVRQGASSRPVVQIIIQGSVNDPRHFIDVVRRAVNDEDVMLIGPNSRNASILRGA